MTSIEPQATTTTPDPNFIAQQLLTKQWANQLAQKQKEFEELRARLILPRDLATVKLQTEEEIGIVWQERLYSIDNVRYHKKSECEGARAALKLNLPHINRKLIR